jgi:CBS domain-containing protein
MKCKEIMTKNPEVCTPEDNAATAAQIMKRKNVGAIPVVADLVQKKLVGILTDRDLTLKIDAQAGDAYYTVVKHIMSRAPVTCEPDDDCSRAIQMMAEHQVRRIPIVTREGQLLGIVSRTDIARYCTDVPGAAAMLARMPDAAELAVRKPDGH